MQIRLSPGAMPSPKRSTGLIILLCIIVYIVFFYHDGYQTIGIEALLGRIARETFEYPGEKYHVIPNIVRPDAEWHNAANSEIVICTQTSVENLHHVKIMSERWDGRISIAVFASGGEIIKTLHYIMLLRKCSFDVRVKTSFHIVYPNSHPPTSLAGIKDLSFECHILETLRVSYGGENYGRALPYPVNVLRNVALMFSGGTHVVNLDIDFLMPEGMKQDIEEYLDNRSQREKLRKIAYIIPCFESNATEYLNSKGDLKRAARTGKVRPFTVMKCNHCQNNTNYPRWLGLPYPSAMAAAYPVEYQPHYEPFYVAEKKHLPMFDGRFKQYGYNRFSQICETYVSGFDYLVLNNAFVVHDGFKDPGGYYHWKVQDNAANDYLFTAIFIRELKRKYPYSDRQCTL